MVKNQKLVYTLTSKEMSVDLLTNESHLFVISHNQHSCCWDVIGLHLPKYGNFWLPDFFVKIILSFSYFQDLKNQILTTNLWVKTVSFFKHHFVCGVTFKPNNAFIKNKILEFKIVKQR